MVHFDRTWDRKPHIVGENLKNSYEAYKFEQKKKIVTFRILKYIMMKLLTNIFINVKHKKK